MAGIRLFHDLDRPTARASISNMPAATTAPYDDIFTAVVSSSCSSSPLPTKRPFSDIFIIPWGGTVAAPAVVVTHHHPTDQRTAAPRAVFSQTIVRERTLSPHIHIPPDIRTVSGRSRRCLRSATSQRATGACAKSREAVSEVESRSRCGCRLAAAAVTAAILLLQERLRRLRQRQQRDRDPTTW
jgi:hypothetical protein